MGRGGQPFHRTFGELMPSISARSNVAAEGSLGPVREAGREKQHEQE